jgi:hypothetical protein
MVQQGVSKFDVALMNLEAIQSGAWFSFFFVTVAATGVLLYRKKKVGTVIFIAILFFCVVNSIRFNSRFISLFDPRPYTQSNSVVRFLNQDKSKFRVHDYTQNSQLNLPFYKIELAAGYHGNQLKWYDQLIGGTAMQNLINPSIVNLLGVKYLIIPPNQSIPNTYFGSKPTSTVLNFGAGQLIENDNAYPRAYLVKKYKQFDNNEEMYREIVTGQNDLRNIVFLEEEPGISLSDSINLPDSAWIISYHPDSVSIGIDSKANSILVLTDNYYDSWKAYIDDNPAKILRAYGSFRAVAIPAGAQRVDFKYESKRYASGKAVTWATLFYLLVIFGVFSVKSYLNRSKKSNISQPEN